MTIPVEFLKFDMVNLSDLVKVGAVFGFILGMMSILLFALVYFFKKFCNKA